MYFKWFFKYNNMKIFITNTGNWLLYCFARPVS